jgi:uncharacterized protein YbjT (DUF2867 family)
VVADLRDTTARHAALRGVDAVIHTAALHALPAPSGRRSCPAICL